MIGNIAARIRNRIKAGRAQQTPSAPTPGPVADVKVDHKKKTITGGVYLPRSGPCPQAILVRPERGKPWHSPCIGEKGHPLNDHPLPSHMDRDGRRW